MIPPALFFFLKIAGAIQGHGGFIFKKINPTNFSLDSDIFHYILSFLVSSLKNNNTISISVLSPIISSTLLGSQAEIIQYLLSDATNF